MGVGERPIENMIPLLEQHGILIVCLETETDAIDAFTQRFSLDNGDKIYVIGYSANKKSAARVHFDLAHELGHIACMTGKRLMNLKERNSSQENRKPIVLHQPSYYRKKHL